MNVYNGTNINIQLGDGRFVKDVYTNRGLRQGAVCLWYCLTYLSDIFLVLQSKVSLD